jgi:hypothetical protein
MNQTKISKALRSLVFVAASAASAASFAAGPSVLQIAVADGYATEATQAWRAYDAHLSEADRMAMAWTYDDLISAAPTAAGMGEVYRVAGYPDLAVIP